MQVMMNRLLLFLGILGLWISCSCMENDDDLALCTYSADYDPVCGCNDKTYPNSCIASCSSIDNFQLGECP